MTTIDIAPYPFSDFGRSRKRARITVKGAEGDRKPDLDFQPPGTFFRDMDGKRWKVLSSEVVEEESPYGFVEEESPCDFSRGPAPGYVYYWEYDAEAVVEQSSSGSWEDF